MSSLLLQASMMTRNVFCNTTAIIRHNNCCRSSSSSSWGRKALLSTTATTTTPSSLSLSSWDKMGVIGLGLMGHGIVQVSAFAPNNVHTKIIAYEQQQDYLDRGKDRIMKSVTKLI